MRKPAALLLVLFGCVCLLLVWAVRRQPGVTLENARRIRCGMTVQEVEQLMGGSCATSEHRKMWTVSRVWKAGDLEIEVLFSEMKGAPFYSQVLDATYHTPDMGPQWEYLDEVHTRESSLLDKLRGWLVPVSPNR